MSQPETPILHNRTFALEQVIGLIKRIRASAMQEPRDRQRRALAARTAMHQYSPAICQCAIDSFGGAIEAGCTLGQEWHPDHVGGLVRRPLCQHADNQSVETGVSVSEAANKEILDNFSHH